MSSTPFEQNKSLRSIDSTAGCRLVGVARKGLAKSDAEVITHHLTPLLLSCWIWSASIKVNKRIDDHGIF